MEASESPASSTARGMRKRQWPTSHRGLEMGSRYTLKNAGLF